MAKFKKKNSTQPNILVVLDNFFKIKMIFSLYFLLLSNNSIHLKLIETYSDYVSISLRSDFYSQRTDQRWERCQNLIDRIGISVRKTRGPLFSANRNLVKW